MPAWLFVHAGSETHPHLNIWLAKRESLAAICCRARASGGGGSKNTKIRPPCCHRAVAAQLWSSGHQHRPSHCTESSECVYVESVAVCLCERLQQNKEARPCAQAESARLCEKRDCKRDQGPAPHRRTPVKWWLLMRELICTLAKLFKQTQAAKAEQMLPRRMVWKFYLVN